MIPTLADRHRRPVPLVVVVVATMIAYAVLVVLPTGPSRAAADPVPGCGTGENKVVQISRVTRQADLPFFPTRDEGVDRVFQSRCEAARSAAGFTAAANQLSTASGATGGASIGFAILKKFLANFASIFSALVAVGTITNAQVLKNLADQITSANAGCGDLGIAYRVAWKESRQNILQLDFSDFYCQAGPGGSPPERPVSIGPYSLELAPPQADLAFAIDNTGSMDDDIAAVQSAATAIVDGLDKDRWVDYRVAVVTYNDPGASTVLGFSTDKAAITGAVRSITAGGGGDTPEAVYNGLMTAIRLPWRTAATKSVIAMGDAPPHDPESGTGYTGASVVAAANAVGVSTLSASTAGASTAGASAAGAPTRRAAGTAATTAAAGSQAGTGVDLHAVVIGADGAALSAFRQLATGTGGEVAQAATATDAVAALDRALDTALLDPLTQVVVASAPWVEPTEWYSGTGTMSGVRRVAGVARAQYVCDDDDGFELSFAFRLPGGLDRTRLRWWANNFSIDSGLRSAYGSVLPSVGTDGSPTGAAVLCLPDDGRLPAGLDTVSDNLRMSW